MMTDNVTMEELIERLRNAIRTGTTDLPVPVGFAMTSLDTWEVGSPAFRDAPSPRKLTTWTGTADDYESTCNLDDDDRCTNPEHDRSKDGDRSSFGEHHSRHPLRPVPPSLERAITNLAGRMVKETRQYLARRASMLGGNPARIVWVFSRKAPIKIALAPDSCSVTVTATIASRS